MVTLTATAPAWGDLHPGRLATVCIGLVRYRIVRGALRRPLIRMLARLGPTFDVEVTGLRLRCRIDDNRAEMRAIFNRLEEAGRITRRLKPGQTFVDVGANSGIFTAHAAKVVGAEGRVLAVEPSPLLVERLRFNASANGFQNVRVAQVAAGDARGTATLHVVSHARGRSSLHALGMADTQLAVQVEPLAAILTQHGIDKIDAMKIDIEGYEDRALVPFFQTARRSLWPRAILIEKRHAENWATDCLGMLGSCGYRSVWEGGNDVLLELRDH